jgi:hypothetical protein
VKKWSSSKCILVDAWVDILLVTKRPIDRHADLPER